MATPKKVKEKAEAADKLQRQLAEGNTGEKAATPAPPTPPVATEEAGETAPTAEAAPEVQPTETAQPVTATETPVQTETAGEEVTVEDPAKLLHSYKVLKGKYNAEVPQLAKDKKALQNQLTEAQNLIVNLMSGSQPGAETAAPAAGGGAIAFPTDGAAEATPLTPSGAPTEDGPGTIPGPVDVELTPITSQDTDEHGDNWFKFVIRSVEHYFKEKGIAQTLGSIETRIRNLETATAKNTSDGYYDVIYDKVKDFDAVNENPLFISWLDEADPRTGYVWNDLLQNAHKSMDAQKVINIVNTWKEDSGLSVVDAGAASGRNLETEVIPDERGGTETPGAAPNLPTYTLDQYKAKINEITALRREKKISDEEYNKRFAQLIAANNEGRVKAAPAPSAAAI